MLESAKRAAFPPVISACAATGRVVFGWGERPQMVGVLFLAGGYGVALSPAR